MYLAIGVVFVIAAVVLTFAPYLPQVRGGTKWGDWYGWAIVAFSLGIGALLLWPK